MVEDNEPPVHVYGSGGVQFGHKAQHVTVETVAILLHEFDEVPVSVW